MRFQDFVAVAVVVAGLVGCATSEESDDKVATEQPVKEAAEKVEKEGAPPTDDDAAPTPGNAMRCMGYLSRSDDEPCSYCEFRIAGVWCSILQCPNGISSSSCY